ncbi:MAG: hypothetical protein WDO16_17010 [Bacteroidota bacterium]
MLFPRQAAITIPNEPTTAGSAWQTNTIQGNAFRTQWTAGDGSGRLIIARKNAAVTALPVDGTNYTASAIFWETVRKYPQASSWLYDDVNRVLDMQGLETGTVYHFRCFLNTTYPAETKII